MCHIPSYRIVENQKVIFITDKEAKNDIFRSIEDSTGHSALDMVYPESDGAEDLEGLNKHTPKVIVKALQDGKMNEMIGAGHLQIAGGKHKLPMKKCHFLSLTKGAILNAPNLTKIYRLRMTKSCVLIAPKLNYVDCDRRTRGAKVIAPEWPRENRMHT